jgi:urocanate hydratase
VYDALEQAERNLIKSTKPIAILKGDRKQPLALVYAEDLLEILTCSMTKKKK